MELRTKAAACCLMVFALPSFAELSYQVRHEHLRKGCSGVLRIDERGISFQGTSRKKQPHAWQWGYAEIQQLTVSADELRVLTYRDNLWKLGADREYRFRALGGQRFAEIHAFLKDRLDQRLVVRLADSDLAPLWQLPVKLLGRVGGSHGVLIVGAEGLVYRAERPGASRTWRLKDIESVSSSGPFELGVVTYERARLQYGSRSAFRFQLKEPLAQERYDELWRRLNQAKGLRVLMLNTRKETSQ
jgi:hypothetical protein